MKISWRNSALALLSVIVISCSAAVTSIYKFDYPMTPERAESLSGNFSAAVPQGWFTAVDNECNCRDLWIVRDDYSASISFSVIYMDSLTRAQISGNELEGIADISRDFKRIKFGKNFKEYGDPENFEIDSLKCSAYKYLDENNLPVRVVVFGIKEIYFECSANSTREISAAELFTVQNSVIASLRNR